MAELFGRADGCAHGRGGSMHLLDVDARLLRRLGHRRRPAADRDRASRSPSSARARQQAVLCELGDGAMNMGAWHESLNLAALWNLPVVFLVVNNGYGMGTERRRARRPSPSSTGAPRAFRMHGERVDGNDLEAVLRGVRPAARGRAREERQPGGARGHDLPLPRPLGRRRRPRLPHQGRDRRATKRTTRSPRTRGAARGAGVDEAELDAVDDEVERARSRPRSRSPRPARPRGRRRWPPTSTAPGSDEQFARMRPGQPVRRGGARLRRRGSADERRRRGRATERMTYREALRLALREELARDERVFAPWARRSASSRAPTRSPPGCSTSSARTACATRRSAEEGFVGAGRRRGDGAASARSSRS